MRPFYTSAGCRKMLFKVHKYNKDQHLTIHFGKIEASKVSQKYRRNEFLNKYRSKNKKGKQIIAINILSNITRIYFRTKITRGQNTYLFYKCFRTKGLNTFFFLARDGYIRSTSILNCYLIYRT